MMKSQDTPLRVDSMYDVQELQPERFVTKDGKVYTRTVSPGELRYNCNGRDGLETIAIMGNGMQLQQISKTAGNQNKLFDSNGREITDQGVYNQVLVSHYKNVVDQMRAAGIPESEIMDKVGEALANHLDQKGGGRGLGYSNANPYAVMSLKVNNQDIPFVSTWLSPEVIKDAEGNETVVARFNGRMLTGIDCSAFVSLAHYVLQGNRNVPWEEAWTHTADGVSSQYGSSVDKFIAAYKAKFTATAPKDPDSPYYTGPSIMTLNGRDYSLVEGANEKDLIKPGMVLIMRGGPGTPFNYSSNGGTFMSHTGIVTDYKPGQSITVSESVAGKGPGTYTYDAKTNPYMYNLYTKQSEFYELK